MRNITRVKMKNILTNKNILICAVLLNVIFFFYFLHVKNSFIRATHSVELFEGYGKFHQQPCQMQHLPENTNIYFLKTHKTASSTVQNIIMRFGFRHSLNFLLPKTNNYLGYSKTISLSDLDEKSIPLDEKFNIFTHHSRFHQKTSQFLYSGTKKITILRNPAELFESIFNYYNLQKFYKITFQQLLASLPRGVNMPVSTKRKVQGRNQMSRDLGLNVEFYFNETAIDNFIKILDQEFDLVMIQEHFEASLILLANLMKWPLQYVSFIPINVRTQDSKYNLTKSDILKLEQFNYADTRLYTYFLKKFRESLEKYGVERMLKSIQKLNGLNEELKKRCILSENLKGYKKTISYEIRNNSEWECVYSTKNELSFTDELRNAQIQRLKPTKKLIKLLNSEQ